MSIKLENQKYALSGRLCWNAFSSLNIEEYEVVGFDRDELKSKV